MWQNKLPLWIQEEYARLDRGELPTKATIEAVLGKGWENALDASNGQ